VKAILIFTCSLIYSCIYGQKTIDSLQIENPLLNIGKKIGNQSNFETSKYEFHGCQYLPAQKDSILFDGVAFGKVVVTLNKRDKIERISFRRLYSGVDSSYLNQILDKDFAIIANWITQKYSYSEYLPNRQYGDSRVWNEAYRWTIKKRKIRLIKSFDQERSKNKLYNSLVLEIY